MNAVRETGTYHTSGNNPIRIAALTCIIAAVFVGILCALAPAGSADAAIADLQAGEIASSPDTQGEASPAPQASPVAVPTGVYSLEPQCAPGSCLDVDGASSSNGANVQIWESNGSAAQTFNIISTGSNTYKIQAQCSGKMLDVAGGNDANGANVQQYTDNGSFAQAWTFEPAGNGYYYILNAYGRALDVRDCGYTNGTNVQIWAKNTNTAQKWRLVPRDKNAHYAALWSDGYLHRTNSTHSFDYGYKWGNSESEMNAELDKITTLFINANVSEIGTVYVERYSGSYVKTENSKDTVRFQGDWGWTGPHNLKTVEFLTANGKNSCNSISYAQTHCFVGQTKLTTVKNLDKTQLRTIPLGCFENCTSLTSIAMPNTATTIEEDAFYGCSKLTSVKIGTSVSEIQKRAFEKCTALAQIDLPKSVKSVQPDAFRNCTKLTKVIMRSPSLVNTSGYVFSYYVNNASCPLTKNGTKSYIYVPNALLSQYTSASSSNKWNTYRTHFRPFYTMSAIGTQAYTGKAVKPAVTVTYLGGKLSSKYYSVSYSNNVKPGTAKAKVTLRSGHSGTLARSFKIVAPTVTYRTHVQNIGWQKYVKNGATAGTSGRSLRLEGANIKLASKPVSGGIQYRTHIQNIGWEKKWKADGAMTGTSGRSLRLEAIQIKLTGNMAKKYDVYYRVHCQHFGWMGWAKNGSRSGSAGYSYRLEALQVKLVPKGMVGPKSSAAAFRQR